MKVLLTLVVVSFILSACHRQDTTSSSVSKLPQNVADKSETEVEIQNTSDSTTEDSLIPDFPFPPPPPPPIYDCIWLTENKKGNDPLKPDSDPDYPLSTELDSGIEYYTDLIPAHFPGGNELLPAYIKEHLHYPTELKEQEIEGSVYVRFTVSSVGKVREVRIERGLFSETDSLCAQVFRRMPKWVPAMSNGKAISTSYLVPIKFSLKGNASYPRDSSSELIPILPSYYSPASNSNEPVKHENEQSTGPEKEQPTFELYPNPATDYCHISVNTFNTDMVYAIFNSTGQKLVQGRLLGTKQKIDLKELPSGNFIVVVTSLTMGFKTSKQLIVR